MTKRYHADSTVILRRRIAGLSQRTMADFVTRVSARLRLRGAATVLVTSSREMRTLNQHFRGKNMPTDVLSFPSPGFVHGFAGDIALSFEIAAKNARLLGHSLSAEVRILTLHGLLHLAGYDHESDNGEMKRIETRLRSEFGLPIVLTERGAEQSRIRRRTRP